MKQIEFPPGTHRRTKRMVGAIAWATNRRGRLPWKSENVTSSIVAYLRQHQLGFEVDTTHVSNTLGWLDEHGYGTRVMSDTGRRTREFAFHNDVNLNGYRPGGEELSGQRRTPSPGEGKRIDWDGMLDRVPIRRATLDEVLEAVKEAADDEGWGLKQQTQVEQIAAQRATDVDLPLPFSDEEKPAPYRFQELWELLYELSDADPERYASWVDRVIEQLTKRKESAS